MDISSKHRQILIDLYSSPSGLFAYTLYGRYGLTPSEAVSFIEVFKGEGIVDIDQDNKIRLTGEGRKRILSLVNVISHTTEQRINFGEHFQSTKTIEINVPYLPNDVFYYRYNTREVDKTSQ